MRISYEDARQASAEPMLSRAEELDLIDAWQERGDRDALERLVRSHARLAFSIAAKYTSNKTRRRDLAQEGMLGICRAADKYRKEFGTRFSSYCTWWIRTFIAAAVAQVSTVIDMPSKVFLDARRGRLPERLPKRLQGVAKAAAQGAVPLDAPLGEDGTTTMLDMVRCQRPGPDGIVEAGSVQHYYERCLRAAMGVLTPREASVLKRRRLGNHEETLEAIAVDLGVTRERVRQIEVKAIEKVKQALVRDGFSSESLL